MVFRHDLDSAGRAALDPGTLLRGEANAIASWIESWSGERTSQQVLMIIAGAGAFGAAMGCWRDPGQAGFAAIKLPLIVLATACGNALINGMLAPLLGLNLSLHQSFAAVLMSFGRFLQLGFRHLEIRSPAGINI